MKRTVHYKSAILAFVAMLFAPPVLCAHWGGPGSGGRFEGQQQRQEMQGRPDRSFQREAPVDRPQRAGRMTDEERRELHRDLDQANRQIYRGQR